MKTFVRGLAIGLAIFAMTSVVAFAKSKRESVTFPYDVKVNGTLVKKGDYDIKFDEATKELSILRGGKVVAQATAQVEQQEKKTQSIKFTTIGRDNDQQLLSVTFSGSNEKLVLNSGEAAAN